MPSSTRSPEPEPPLVIGAEPGPEVHLLRLGATVHRLLVTGGDGVRRNVTLANPTPEERLATTDFLGATIGRYANRIAHGRFPLDGEQVQVGTSDRGHSLHGGPDGFDRRTWDVVEHGSHHAVLALHSPDGDQGFPGAVDVTARFEVAGDTLTLTLGARTDAPTLVNLTQHLYLNLDGEGAGTVDDHELQVAADEYTPVDDTGIPGGPHAAVAGTPFDLREPRRIGDAVRSDHEQVRAARGIDHNFVLRGAGWRTAAVLTSRRSRTRMELATDQPGLQVYTGNFLDGTSRSTAGGLHRQGDGVALEPQNFPDSPNQPTYPSSVLRPGETYTARMAWTFSAVDDDR